MCGWYQHDHVGWDHGLEHGLPGLEKKVGSGVSIPIMISYDIYGGMES